LKKIYVSFFLAAIAVTVAVVLIFFYKVPVYENPVFEPVLADPSAIKGEDGYFYAYGTEDVWDDSQTKLVPIVRSKNLIDWEFVGEAFINKPDWKGIGNIWAPHIAKYNGKYYLYYSISIWGDSDPGIGVAVSDKLKGPFKDKGKLFTSSEIGVKNSIDPFLLIDDGKPYLFWGSFNGIFGVELTKDGLKVKGEPFQIAGTAFEAPWIIKKAGFYYFFGSLGSCCEGENSTYHVAVARSRTLKGPYVDDNGNDIMSSNGKTILEGGKKFVGPGHIAIVKDDRGKEWLLYHAIDKANPLLWNGVSRRPLFIDPIQWENGWPTVEGGIPREQKRKGPFIR